MGNASRIGTRSGRRSRWRDGLADPSVPNDNNARVEEHVPVFAVVNRKGGSGKSTLATQLAGCLANRGLSVMLGDTDRQRSTAPWLRRRAARALPSVTIVGWALDPKNVMRPPAGVSHVVIDTPGALQGFDLARILMFADVVLIPVCDSAFDRESSAACLAEIRQHPRFSSGRCKVAVLGMRIDSRTRGPQRLQTWADEHDVPLIGMLREAQAYVRCVERGLTIFDLPATRVQADIEQWQPILQWLGSWLDAPAPRPAQAQRPATTARTAPLQPAAALRAAPEPAPATTHAATRRRQWFAWVWPVPAIPRLKR
jgi:chromosome partitioning protein